MKFISLLAQWFFDIMNKCTYIQNDSIWKHAIAVEITFDIFVPFKTRPLERSVISLQSIQKFNF